MLGMPGQDIRVWSVRPKRSEGHGQRSHKHHAAQLYPRGKKEVNQRKGKKGGGREGGGREKVFWTFIQKSRTFITKFEVRPGNLNCYQLRVSPSASRSLEFQGPQTILRSKLEEISKETKY